MPGGGWCRSDVSRYLVAESRTARLWPKEHRTDGGLSGQQVCRQGSSLATGVDSQGCLGPDERRRQMRMAQFRWTGDAPPVGCSRTGSRACLGLAGGFRPGGRIAAVGGVAHRCRREADRGRNVVAFDSRCHWNLKTTER